MSAITLTFPDGSKRPARKEAVAAKAAAPKAPAKRAAAASSKGKAPRKAKAEAAE